MESHEGIFIYIFIYFQRYLYLFKAAKKICTIESLSLIYRISKGHVFEEVVLLLCYVLFAFTSSLEI